VWTLVAAAVAVQIAYPLMPESWRTEVTVASVVVFFVASVADRARVHGLTGAAVLGGSRRRRPVAEASGGDGLPFGHYIYTGTLGPEVLGVSGRRAAGVGDDGLARLVVARTLVARGPAVAASARGAHRVGRVPRPQMVAAGHWTWSDTAPGLPLIPGIPLTNYIGWLLVSVVIMAILDRALPREHVPSAPRRRCICGCTSRR
jgi:putative membrane protein